MAAVVVMLFATCLSAAKMTPAQRACCEAMHHDCAEMAVQSSCCAGQTQEDPGLIEATKPTAGSPPVALLVAVFNVRLSSPTPSSSWSRLDTSSPSPPGVPTYLFVSSLRL